MPSKTEGVTQVKRNQLIMENYEEKFEAYFRGKMTDSDILAFNAELDSDPDFKQEYDHFLSVKKATSVIERDKMRAQLNDVNATKESSHVSPTSSSSTSWIKWLIGIVALCFVSYFIFKSISPKQPEELYAQNFEIYEAQSARGDNTDELKAYYNKGLYREFIEQATNITKDAESNMMLANAYMERNNFALAEKTLENISDDSSLRDLKYWNLALVNLRLNKLEKAEEFIRKLQSLGNFKKSEAEFILSQIAK